MNQRFARQLSQATRPNGDVDIAHLCELVSAEYDEATRNRDQARATISQMMDELDGANRRLEALVSARTAELRAREDELREQNLRFDDALNNMSQALLMFDASARLVICNKRYLELYRLAPDTVTCGCSLRELLEARAGNGTYAGDIPDYIEHLTSSIAAGKSVTVVLELTDGRTIVVANEPIEGGGWVATHEDITERRRAEKQIAHMARHDALTDLPNRVLLRERLTTALADLTPGERLAVLYLDLDLFKGVNDTLGHQIGDELLKAVAQRLRACVADGDTVARVGGDEFAIINIHVERPDEAAALARRIRHAIRAPFDIDGHAIIVDTSIGIAIAPDDGHEPSDLLKNADMALYGAKGDGRGTFRFFESEMDARVKRRRNLEVALRQALTAGEFEVYYQPLLDLADGRITCCEALVRWHHPERGLVTPAEFIPVAEEIGLILPLGEWVLRRACADAATWPDNIKVAVNLSPIQVMNHHLVPLIISALSSAGLEANRLEVEITESMLMQNSEATLATLHRLRQLGVRISMDDFGTGYSSLSYLRSFPFDKIKIDRGFISGLPDGEDAIAIVRAVASLAKNLNIETTAEGIETQQQMDQVRALGCTEMQGFLFSRPKPHAELSALLPRTTLAQTG